MEIEGKSSPRLTALALAIFSRTAKKAGRQGGNPGDEREDRLLVHLRH